MSFYSRRFTQSLALFLGSAICSAQSVGSQQQQESSRTIPAVGATNSTFGSSLPATIDLTPTGQLPVVLPGSQGAVAPTLPESTAVQYVPGEFETYVQGLAQAQEVRRLGANLVVPGPGAVDTSPLVPADYLVVPGDELALTIWGSVNADLRAVVDRSGRISIPRVGPVLVAGVRYADLPDVITKRVGRQFKNFELSVSLAQLRAIRVYVTGYVNKPGAHSLASLSTISSAVIKAGGPTAAGSFRDMRLIRRGQPVATFDLYDLLVAGNRSGDLTLQPDDVVHVGPIGPQVALIGSVNQPAVLELKAGDNLDAAIRMAGGLSAVADITRATIEPLSARDGARVVELKLPAGGIAQLHAGDVVRVFSAVDARLPLAKQNKRVIVEGEVVRPGTYVLPANSSIQDALAAAGGMTDGAYVFGTQFTRESVRQTQQENYDRALRDLESDLTRAATTQRTASAEEAAAVTAKTAGTARLVSVLRSVKPSGRIVLQLAPNSVALPNLTLEDGDRLYIPARPTSIGVFGSVFNAGSYLHDQGQSVEDFIQLAGGPTRGADKGSTFVIRANGGVVSNLQSNGWFSDERLSAMAALPGDTVFVPEELNKTTFVQHAKDWTQILYQFGIGAAALNALK